MKKLAIFLAIMLIPFSAFALDTISDSDLNDVTGQAGVSIYTNSINIVKTGVTTTYIDDDTNSITITSALTDTSIFFKGADPIMIDVVNMDSSDGFVKLLNNVQDGVDTDLAGAAPAYYPKTNTPVTSDADYGSSAVWITIPDAVVIVNNADSDKSYYTTDSSDVANEILDEGNRLITVVKSAGTTTIQHAQKTWKDDLITRLTAAQSQLGTLDGSWTTHFQNKIDDVNAGVHHQDQIHIVVTAHEGKG